MNDYERLPSPEELNRQQRRADVSPEHSRHDARHEQLLKAIAVLDTSVTELESRMGPALTPEPSEPNSDDSGGPKLPLGSSMLQIRHDDYLRTIFGVERRLRGLIDRIDL